MFLRLEGQNWINRFFDLLCSGINVENPDRPGGPPGSGGIVKDILRKAAQCVQYVNVMITFVGV